MRGIIWSCMRTAGSTLFSAPAHTARMVCPALQTISMFTVPAMVCVLSASPKTPVPFPPLWPGTVFIKSENGGIITPPASTAKRAYISKFTAPGISLSGNIWAMNTILCQTAASTGSVGTSCAFWRMRMKTAPLTNRKSPQRAVASAVDFFTVTGSIRHFRTPCLSCVPPAFRGSAGWGYSRPFSGTPWKNTAHRCTRRQMRSPKRTASPRRSAPAHTGCAGY